MSIILIKILGTITFLIFYGGMGGIFGIVMSYMISISKPGFIFNYRLAFILGIAGGIYGVVSSIRQLWLR
jgi:hypothetical protein